MQLIEIIPGPDFPTGGIICGRQGILDGYRTGRGKVTLRARAEISRGRQPQRRSSSHEVPYQQTRNRLAEAIGELVKDERIKGIRDIRDESSARNGEPVRLVIDLKRDADPHLVLNQLYQFSPLQKTVSIILLALVDGRPRTLTLKQMLEEFLRHRVQVIRRRTEYLLREAKRRGAHPRRPAHRHLVARRGDPHLPRVAEPGRGQGALAEPGGRRRRAGAGPGRRAFRRPAARDRRARRATA